MKRENFAEFRKNHVEHVLLKVWYDLWFFGLLFINSDLLKKELEL